MQTSPKVFISHSSHDKGVARRVFRSLTAHGIEAWLDEKGIRSGDHIPSVLKSRIEDSRAVIVIASANSAKSLHVEMELSHAGQLKIPIIPVFIDSLSDWKPFIDQRGIDATDPLLFEEKIDGLIADLHRLFGSELLPPDPALLESGLRQLAMDEPRIAPLVLGALGSKALHEDNLASLKLPVPIVDEAINTLYRLFPREETAWLAADAFREQGAAAWTLNSWLGRPDRGGIPLSFAVGSDRFDVPAIDAAIRLLSACKPPNEQALETFVSSNASKLDESQREVVINLCCWPVRETPDGAIMMAVAALKGFPDSESIQGLWRRWISDGLLDSGGTFEPVLIRLLGDLGVESSAVDVLSEALQSHVRRLLRSCEPEKIEAALLYIREAANVGAPCLWQILSEARGVTATYEWVEWHEQSPEIAAEMGRLVNEAVEEAREENERRYEEMVARLDGTRSQGEGVIQHGTPESSEVKSHSDPPMKKQPLLVHIVFHPDSGAARKLAQHIHRQFNGDRMVPGLRVPTVFCEATTGNKPPPGIRFGHAERNFVIVLSDDHLTVDSDWCRFVGDVWEECEKRPEARFLPVQLTKNAWPLDKRMRGVNFARALDVPEEEARTAWTVRRIVVELCRYLANLNPVTEDAFGAPIQVFLSHTKIDLGHDAKVTKTVIDSLKADQPIEAWVDSGDIPTGSRFAEAIEDGIKKTSLLVILTDAYATREWCREEILLAKEYGRPVAVIEALDGYEERSFPYLGNVPRIHWDGDPQKGIDLLLKETLRHLHDEAVLNGRKEPGDIVFTRPPELATLVGLGKDVTVLYPDPPVGVGERKRLEKAGVTFTTPLERLAVDRSLAGFRIALSMSESTDIALYGMDPLHLEGCMVELSRYLLVKGAALAYGGHLGEKGYTRKLFELVRTHNSLEGVEPFESIVNFRGWPLPRLTIEQLAELKDTSQTIQLPRPGDLDESLHPDFLAEPSFFAAEKSPEHRFAWARGMTEMRAFQADRAKSGVAARIVIGGTFGPTVKANEDGTITEKWYASRIPGVLEEVVLSILHEQPVFLIGAFGGVAELVIDLLRGEDRPEATWDYQKRAPHAPAMRTIYEQRGFEWMDYPEMVSLIRGKGIEGINPLLNREEQEELFDAVDPLRVTELVLMGLSRLQ